MDVGVAVVHRKVECEMQQACRAQDGNQRQSQDEANGGNQSPNRERVGNGTERLPWFLPVDYAPNLETAGALAEPGPGIENEYG